MNLLPQLIRDAAVPLIGAKNDYDPLLDLVGDSKLVLIGEATHGTHEFYRERAQITKRLIQEKGFSAVAIEGDWPDTYHVNRYVQGFTKEVDSVEALSGYKRFPAWMWRNADVLDFIGWLRNYNDSLDRNDSKIGFYGLDLYSLPSSMEAVLNYLDRIDPKAARRARAEYACFDRFGTDPQNYGFLSNLGLSVTCEHEVVQVLADLRIREQEYLSHDGVIASEEFFCAEQNAKVVQDSERYYRSMFSGRVPSWNLRDSHMMETLESLLRHVEERFNKSRSKIVVWAHNSHLGDARATQMSDLGESNLGQHVREKYPTCCTLIGFTTYQGTVTAASEWDGPAERKQIRDAISGSYEALFHEVKIPRFFLDLKKPSEARFNLEAPLLERAIGVIYKPETERQSHYLLAKLPSQFDAIIHVDQTRAVEPLERNSEWEPSEVPETFPTGV